VILQGNAASLLLDPHEYWSGLDRQSRLLAVSVGASILLHAVLMTIHFRFPDALLWKSASQPLEVILVNAKTREKPSRAKALAQANLDGGGNTDQKLRARSPFPSVDPRDPSQELRAAESRMKQLENEAKELMTRMKSKATVAPVEPIAQGAVKPDAEARDLVEKSLEIARLEAQIRRDFQAYQERPKRRFIGARAQEYRFAQYVDNWRLKIERIGNLNYPEEAKARKIYGSLQLTVAIKADGEVESVEVNRSSGYRFLDQAAVRIVRLAAPFDRFPDNIRSDTDILHITRTWTFTRADQVLAE
jgi:periplasmic protein TonB